MKAKGGRSCNPSRKTITISKALGPINLLVGWSSEQYFFGPQFCQVSINKNQMLENKLSHSPQFPLCIQDRTSVAILNPPRLQLQTVKEQQVFTVQYSSFPLFLTSISVLQHKSIFCYLCLFCQFYTNFYIVILISKIIKYAYFNTNQILLMLCIRVLQVIENRKR